MLDVLTLLKLLQSWDVNAIYLQYMGGWWWVLELSNAFTTTCILVFLPKRLFKKYLQFTMRFN